LRPARVKSFRRGRGGLSVGATSSGGGYWWTMDGGMGVTEVTDGALGVRGKWRPWASGVCTASGEPMTGDARYGGG
jgi:hypothetical protein